MRTDVSGEITRLDEAWHRREAEWAYKLGRLHLNAEPLEEQVLRYLRVTWALTGVIGVIASMFFCLFAVFGRPDVGLVVVAILLIPMIAVSWVSHLRLRRRAAAYLEERRAYHDQRQRLLESGTD